MSNVPKRRFVELSVDEVSIVDSPANEEHFIVIKNLQDLQEVNMPGEKNEETTKDVVKNDDTQQNPEKIPVEVDKATDEAVAKAMEQVADLINNISKSFDNVGEKAGDKDEQVSKKKEGEEEKKEGGEEKKEVQTNKNAEKIDDNIREAASEAVYEAIAKAKRFTPTREAALKAAIETLNKLAKELGMQEIPIGSSPSTNTPSGTTFGSSSITKSMEDFVAKLSAGMEKIVETTKNLDSRMEKIEKMAAPSKSVEGDGETDNKVEKNQNFWKGVI
jgi:hypothetical protein